MRLTRDKLWQTALLALLTLAAGICVFQEAAVADRADSSDLDDLQPNRPNDIRGQTLLDLNKTIEKRPDSWEGYYDRAMYHRQRDERNDAINDYSKAIERAPKNGQAIMGRAEMYVMTAHYDKAIADMDTALKMYPKWIQAYLERARAETAMEAYAKAVADIEKALTLGPNNADALDKLAMAYDNLGNHEKAVDAATRSVVMGDQYDRHNLHFFLQDRALIWAHAHKYDFAYRDLARGLLVKPEHSQLWAYLAYTFAMDDKLDAARGAIRKTQGLESFPPRGFRLKAEMYRAAGKWLEALQDYSTSTSMEPDYGPGFTQRAIAEIALGQYTSAVDDLQKAVGLLPNSALSYSYLALGEDQLGEAELARQHIDKAFSLTENLPMNYVNRARIALHHGELAKAAEDCNKALSLDPLLADAYATANTILEVAGRHEEAKPFLEKAHSMGWRDPAKDLQTASIEGALPASIRIVEPPLPNLEEVVKQADKSLGEAAPPLL